MRGHFYKNHERLGAWDIPDPCLSEIRQPCEKVPARRVPEKLPLPKHGGWGGDGPCAPSKLRLWKWPLCPRWEISVQINLYFLEQHTQPVKKNSGSARPPR